MNVHSKKEKDFMKKVREVLRQKGVRIRTARLTSFVAEHAPPKNEPPEEWQGRVLGRLNANMRLLCALGQFFARESMMYSGDSEKWRDDWGTSSLQNRVCRISLSELSELCNDAFWILVKNRFEDKIDLKTHSFVLKADWSIHAVARSKIPPIPSQLEQLLRRMEGQFIALNIAML